MPGGHVGRSFFYELAYKFLEWHYSQLPDSEFTAEEEEAGFDTFSKTFSFYATLDNMAGGDITKHRKILAMPYRDVYFNIRFKAWKAYHEKRYQKIMSEKK